MSYSGASVPKLNEEQMIAVGDVLEKAHRNNVKPPATTKVPKCDGTGGKKQISILRFKYDRDAEYRATVKGKRYMPNGKKPNAKLGLRMHQFGEDRGSMDDVVGIINQMCMEYIGPEIRRRQQILADRGVLNNAHMLKEAMRVLEAEVEESDANEGAQSMALDGTSQDQADRAGSNSDNEEEQPPPESVHPAEEKAQGEESDANEGAQSMALDGTSQDRDHDGRADEATATANDSADAPEYCESYVERQQLKSRYSAVSKQLDVVLAKIATTERREKEVEANRAILQQRLFSPVHLQGPKAQQDETHKALEGITKQKETLHQQLLEANEEAEDLKAKKAGIKAALQHAGFEAVEYAIGTVKQVITRHDPELHELLYDPIKDYVADTIQSVYDPDYEEDGDVKQSSNDSKNNG